MPPPTPRPVLLAAARHGGRAAGDEIGPARLGGGHVLDQAAKAQLAGGGTLRRLLVGEVPDGSAQEAPVQRQCLQQVCALARGGRVVSGCHTRAFR